MLRILTYHRVADPARTPHLDPLLVSAAPTAFRKQMLHVRKRYHPVGASDVLEAFQAGRDLPPRSVWVTVDDAYRDFAHFAWPVLRELRIPVTVFVPTGYPGDPTRSFWWDRLHRAGNGLGANAWGRVVQEAAQQCGLGTACDGLGVRALRSLLRTLPHDTCERFVEFLCRRAGVDSEPTRMDPPTLDWSELRQLGREGVTFGAHTHSHAALSRLGEPRARAEIRQSLADLERELGGFERILAYPYGSHDANVVRIAREEGCALGLTCEDGLNAPGTTDRYRLRRTNITPRTSPSLFAVRLLPWFAAVDRWRHGGRRVSPTAWRR